MIQAPPPSGYSVPPSARKRCEHEGNTFDTFEALFKLSAQNKEPCP